MNGAEPIDRLIDGRFQLLERLGGGGMGLVWRARDTLLQREVALKEVRASDPALSAADPAAAAELRERVLREARALARLQHPNVVVIHHIVDSPAYPHPWLVMELVTGGSLADRLERGPLPAAAVARVGRGLLSALRAAHTAGIVHRDVKPANVLLRDDGTPVLTDFGIAALSDATALTATGALIGSPEYIAPERLRGTDGRPESDLWSLGMLLYVAVEGYHPLRRATTLATLAAVLDEPLPPPTRAGRLGPLLTALLAKDPAARPDPAEVDWQLAQAEQADPAVPLLHAEPIPMPTPADTPMPPMGVPVPADTRVDQIPAGLGTPEPFPITATPFPITAQLPTRPPRRHRGPMAIAASVMVIALAGAVAWALQPTGVRTAHGAGTTAQTTITTTPTADTAPTTNSTNTVAGGGTGSTTDSQVDLLTPDGLRHAIAAMRPALHGTKVYQLVVYPTYAIAEVPTAADPTLYDEIDYRDGQTTRTPGGTTTDGQKPVDLNGYDWNTLPALLRTAQNTLKVPHPSSRYLIIEPDMFDGTPVIAVYLTDDYGSGYLTATPHGTIKTTYPRGS